MWEALALIAVVMAIAGVAWYTARKLSNAEKGAEAGQAEVQAERDRREALERAAAAAAKERKDRDLREAEDVLATPDTADGFEFLRRSFKNPR